jgi:hypothetical protein
VVKLLFLFLIVLSGCSSIKEYKSITVYDVIDNSDDCTATTLEKKGKIIINTSRGFIKANVFGEEKKFNIESYKYSYPPFTIFKQKKDRNAITINCDNGFKFYVLYGRYCVLTIPDDGDEDICDDKIFYDL